MAQTGMLDTQEDKIIEEICGYAEKYKIREMMQDYMKRLVLEQPKEPLKWLIKEITDKPYPTPKVEEEAAEAEETAPVPTGETEATAA